MNTILEIFKDWYQGKPFNDELDGKVIVAYRYPLIRRILSALSQFFEAQIGLLYANKAKIQKLESIIKVIQYNLESRITTLKYKAHIHDNSLRITDYKEGGLDKEYLTVAAENKNRHKIIEETKAIKALINTLVRKYD